MDERHREPAPTPWDDDEGRVEELLERAGPLPELPEEDLEAITATARSAWRSCWGDAPIRETRRPGRRRLAVAAALAATLALAVGLGWWWRGLDPSGSPELAAHLEAVSGSVALAGDAVAAEIPSAGQPVPAGAVIITGGPSGPPFDLEGRVSLRLATGATVRLDAESRLLVVSASVLELARGTVYLDTGTAVSSDARVEVRTALGTARDVGTQFMVRVEQEAMSVRVREGAVAVERGGATFRTGAGRQVVLHRDGRVERREAPGYGSPWEWVTAAAPPFELEGRTLAELLDWVSRETGWRVRFADRALAESADGIVLHGSLGGVGPDQAPFVVLPGAGLEGDLREGVLTVRREGP